MSHPYTEDQLVEQPAIGLFAELGWQVAGPPHARPAAAASVFGPSGTRKGDCMSRTAAISVIWPFSTAAEMADFSESSARIAGQRSGHNLGGYRGKKRLSGLRSMANKEILPGMYADI